MWEVLVLSTKPFRTMGQQQSMLASTTFTAYIHNGTMQYVTDVSYGATVHVRVYRGFIYFIQKFCKFGQITKIANIKLCEIFLQYIQYIDT